VQTASISAMTTGCQSGMPSSAAVAGRDEQMTGVGWVPRHKGPESEDGIGAGIADSHSRSAARFSLVSAFAIRMSGQS
jgi:hypothetical protein